MRILTIIYFLLFFTSSCGKYAAGELLIYGNLRNNTCEYAVAGAKIYLVDAVFLESGGMTEILWLDSVITDVNGRFELINGYYSERNDPGIWVETEHSAFYVRLEKPLRVRHLNLDLCED
jgi:hypothetical protein